MSSQIVERSVSLTLSRTSPSATLRWYTVAGKGAALGFKLAAAYSLAFLTVASVAYWLSVLAAPPGGDLFATLAAGTVSLAGAVLVFGVVCGLVSAVGGALAALGLVAVLRSLAQPLSARRAMFVGLALGLAVVVLGHAVLWLAGLWTPGSIASTTTLFWLEIPSLVFVGACVYGARRAGAA